MTGIFICEKGISEDARKEIRKFKFTRNYLFNIRGYSEARLLVFDLENHKALGNAAAKDLIKGYNRAGIF